MKFERKNIKLINQTKQQKKRCMKNNKEKKNK